MRTGGCHITRSPACCRAVTALMLSGALFSSQALTPDWAKVRTMLGGLSAKFVYTHKSDRDALYMVDISETSPQPRIVAPVVGLADDGPKVSPDGTRVVYATNSGSIYISTLIPNAPMSDLRYIGAGTRPRFWQRPGTSEMYIIYLSGSLRCQKLDRYYRPAGPSTALGVGGAAGRSIDGRFVLGDKAAPIVTEIQPADAVEGVKTVTSYRVTSDGYCQASFSPTISDPTSRYFRCIMHNDITHNAAIIRRFTDNKVIDMVTNPYETGQTGYMPEWTPHVNFGVFSTRTRYDGCLFNTVTHEVQFIATNAMFPYAWVGKLDKVPVRAVIDVALRGPAPFSPVCDGGKSMGGGLTYSWQIAGKSYSGARVTPTFTAPGTYPVKLIVRNASAADSFETTVEAVDPGKFPIPLSVGKPSDITHTAKYANFKSSIPKINDGDPLTIFSCYGTDARFWTSINLGAVQSIDLLVVDFSKVTYRPKGGKFQTSPDSLTWSTVMQVDSFSLVKPDTMPLRASGKYVRLYWDTVATHIGSFTLREFGVYRFAAAGEKVATAVKLDPPGPTTVANGSIIKYTATVLDQYGAPMAGAPIEWSLHGASGGKIDQAGAYTAGMTAEKRDTVVARSGAATGTTVVTVTGSPIFFTQPLQTLYRTGDTVSVRWETVHALVSDVYFHLSLDNGKTTAATFPPTESINLNDPSWGLYKLVLPHTIDGRPATGEQCIITIQAYTGDQAVSSAPFAIRSPSSSVAGPVTGHSGVSARGQNKEIWDLRGRTVGTQGSVVSASKPQKFSSGVYPTRLTKSVRIR